MTDYQKRITATFLAHCAPDTAYAWLSENPHVYGGKLSEYVLLRRKNPLVDLGLAQFARDPYVLRTVFARGTQGVRCAVLSNPCVFEHNIINRTLAINIIDVVVKGNFYELEALATNAHLSDECYQCMIGRTDYFSDLSDINYMRILSCLGHNTIMSIRLDNTIYIDGWTVYMRTKTIEAAWRLCATVPATPGWAGVLGELLRKAQLCHEFKDVEQVIERWRIDPPREDGRPPTSGLAFELRSRLADLLRADTQLFDSPDLALRKSFYRRFDPRQFTDWTEFFEKDGTEFVEELIEGNLHLWQSREHRKRLRELARECPNLHLGVLFDARETCLRNEHPEWFQNEDDEYSTELSAVVRRIEKTLNTMNERIDLLENALSEQDRSAKRWWK